MFLKSRFLLLFLFFISSISFAQTNDEIAAVYIKKANESTEKIDYAKAKYYFEKAMEKRDTITTSNVAWLGAHIYLELKEYYKAKKYAKKYFDLKKNKKSEEYLEFLEVYVDIDEKIFQLEKNKKKQQKEALIVAAKKRKKDSLTQYWNNKIKSSFSIKVDSIYSFNQDGIAVFSLKNKFGLMDDKGKVLVEPTEYMFCKSQDEYSVFLNNSRYPTKIFVYNNKSREGITLPPVTDFNALSDDYGRVMMPRASGKLVAYPNNSTKVFVYDLKEKSVMSSDNFEETIKELKRTDKIEKSNKDGQVRINKEWYYFAGDLGGGMHPLISENYKIAGFLSAVEGKMLLAKDYARVGYIYNGVFETTTKGDIKWIDKKGNEVDNPNNNASKYEGKSKVVRLNEDSYIIMIENIFVKEDKSIERLNDFLMKNFID